jgi:hypothetical protein
MPQVFIGDVFGLNTVYDDQVLNIEQRNFINWPESATYGYFGGGYGINTITRLDFSNETISSPGNNFPATVFKTSGASSSFYGYFGGGFSPPAAGRSDITKFDFSNETVSNSPTRILPQGRGALAATSSSYYAYFGGGSVYPSYYNTITRLDYSIETVSNPGKNLSIARDNLGGVSSSSYGYFGGGYTYSPPTGQVNYCTIDRIDFSNEITSTPGKNLPISRSKMGAVSNTSYGYFVAGQPNTSSSSRLDFSNETFSQPNKNSSSAPYDFGGLSSGLYGYFGGGFPPTNLITRLDYSTENGSNPGKNLPQAAQGNQGLSGGQSIFRTSTISSGYFAGGSQSPSAYRSSILKMDFSTEVLSENPTRNFISARRLSAAAANNFYGYFAGGSTAPPALYFSTVVKLDFSNDTVNEDPTRNLPTSVLSGMEGSYGLSSNSYGYFGGGINVLSRTSQIFRLDFSTDILNNSSLINLPEGRSYGATVTSGLYGYFGGGTISPNVVYISNITRLDFSNETVSNPTNNFSIIKGFVGSSSNNSYGYFAGGLSIPPPGNQLSSITRLDFSSDVISDSPSRNLPVATSSGSGTSNNLYGYFSGGVNPTPSIISTIVRIDFSTETIGLPGKNLPTVLQYMTGISGSSAFTDTVSAAPAPAPTPSGAYSIVSGTKSPVHGTGAGTYVLSGWTGLQNSSVDDSFVSVPLAFSTWTINSTAYSTAYVGSNTYITFGSGSTVFSGLSASNPSLNKFMLGAADNSYQRVQYFSKTTGGQGYTRIRYEGTAGTSGIVGSPNIVYECTFFDPSLFGGKNVIELLVGSHNRTTGQFGVANGSAYYASGTIAAFASYVFEGNSTGTSWTIWTGYNVSGTDY